MSCGDPSQPRPGPDEVRPRPWGRGRIDLQVELALVLAARSLAAFMPCQRTRPKALALA